MTNRVEALSMSWRVGRAIRQEGWGGEILAVHPHNCYLMDEDGAIYAVVEESLGNGPLNLVIPSTPLTRSSTSPSARRCGRPARS
jgi:hypothetical protein